MNKNIRLVACVALVSSLMYAEGQEQQGTSAKKKVSSCFTVLAQKSKNLSQSAKRTAQQTKQHAINASAYLIRLARSADSLNLEASQKMKLFAWIDMLLQQLEYLLTGNAPTFKFAYKKAKKELGSVSEKELSLLKKVQSGELSAQEIDSLIAESDDAMNTVKLEVLKKLAQDRTSRFKAIKKGADSYAVKIGEMGTSRSWNVFSKIKKSLLNKRKNKAFARLGKVVAPKKDVVSEEKTVIVEDVVKKQ